LALVSVDGGESTYLTSGEDGDDAAPTWSPDGRRLAFVRRTPPMHAAGSADQRAAVWVIDADGTGAREVAPLPANLSGVATVDWHPSEPWLLVSTFSEDEARAGVVDTETGRVSDVTGAATFARWTPSGDVVHYTTEGASQQSWWRLVLSRYDAGELVEIEDLGHEDYLYPYFGLSVGPCR
jgi:Tol biopolymer transport system component